MVPLLATETFSRALWGDRAAGLCHPAKSTSCLRVAHEDLQQDLLWLQLGSCTESRAEPSPAGLPRGGTPGQLVRGWLWCVEAQQGPSACERIFLHRLASHQVHPLHSESLMTLLSLPSAIFAPRPVFHESKFLPSLSWFFFFPFHFYIICFLYFLCSTCGSCFAGPLLCKLPFTEEDLPVRDWQEVPGAGQETSKTRELANQQVPVCNSGYAPSITFYLVSKRF